MQALLCSVKYCQFCVYVTVTVTVTVSLRIMSQVTTTVLLMCQSVDDTKLISLNINKETDITTTFNCFLRNPLSLLIKYLNSFSQYILRTKNMNVTKYNADKNTEPQ